MIIKMTELNVFKVEYYWYEGEHEECLLIKDVKKEEFEKDLLEAKSFAEELKGVEIREGEYLGKRYRLECLPEFYEQIIWFLIKKKQYKECQLNEDILYIIDDDSNKEIDIIKNEKTIKKSRIKC